MKHQAGFPLRAPKQKRARSAGLRARILSNPTDPVGDDKIQLLASSLHDVPDIRVIGVSQQCDVCEAVISGHYFHCNKCGNHDECPSCHSRTKHDASHDFSRCE